MTDEGRKALLRDALAQAETHHHGLLELRDRLKPHALGGAAPWDAEGAVAELVRSLRYRLDEIETSQADDAALDAQLRELAIDPAELDDAPEPDWDVVATDMLSAPGSLTGLLYPKPGGCYLSSAGVVVHVRPSCRCPR